MEGVRFGVKLISYLLGFGPWLGKRRRPEAEPCGNLSLHIARSVGLKAKFNVGGLRINSESCKRLSERVQSVDPVLKKDHHLKLRICSYFPPGRLLGHERVEESVAVGLRKWLSI